MKTLKMKLGMLAMAVAMLVSLGSVAMAHGPHGAHGKWANMTEAQRVEHREARLNKRVAELKASLKLSDAQAKQVRQILVAKHADMRALRAKKRGMERGQRGQLRGEFKQIRQRHEAALQKVLTADQLKQLKADRQAKRGQRMERMLKHMEAELKLTPAQSAKARAVWADKKTKREAILKKHNGDFEKARPELKALRKEGKQQLKEILTPAQLERFKQLRKEHHKRFKGFDGAGAGSTDV